jgi:uncharacterized membrane protein YeaQ/YmgE (transglycosylase-associated protein family)
MPMSDVDMLMVVVAAIVCGVFATVLGPRRFGIVGDLVAALIGAFISRWVFIYALGISIVGRREGFNFETGGILWWIDAALTAAVGAVLLLLLLRLIKR